MFIDRCGLLEIIDFSKDIYYVVYKPHTKLSVVILLWISTLLSVLYTAISILFMSTQEFTDLYGLYDFKGLESADQVTFCNLLIAKPIRIFK